MPGEVEWLDPDGVPAEQEETLELGRGWPGSQLYARLAHGPLQLPRPGRIALAPLALVAVLTFGPSGPGPGDAGTGPVPQFWVTWTCASTERAAADSAPAAQDLLGTLLAEQAQHLPHGRTCVSLTRPRLP